MCDYSIISPAYNEEKNIEELYCQLTKVMSKIEGEYEIIFVNDGSRDKSLEVLESLHNKDNRIKIIDFSRNFGHQIAITAGMDFVQGRAIIIMDADMQHPPEMIPEMIQKWKEGYDIVYTIRESTEDEGLFKKYSSGLFYKLLNKITNIEIAENAPDFRLLDRKVVDILKSMKERSRFIRGLISWVGFKQISIRFVAPKRFAGITKYSFGKMLKFSFDGITSFSAFPLKIASTFGFIVSFAGFLYAIYAVYEKLFTNSVIPGWASLLITVLILSGVQLITIGIIGEYIGRIYDESKQRPLYIVKSTIGFDGILQESNRCLEGKR